MLSPVLAPRDEAASGTDRSAPPGLLRCLVVSATAERRRLIRAAAESQAWDAILCRDAGEFLRASFKRSVPLVLVDLPREASREYWDLREATGRAKQVNSSLFVIVGNGAADGEEVWARMLGVLGYVSEVNSQRGFEFMFSEARGAVERTGAVRPAAVGQPLEGDW